MLYQLPKISAVWAFHKPKVINGPPQPILLIYQNFQSRVGTNLVPVLSAVSSVQRSVKPLQLLWARVFRATSWHCTRGSRTGTNHLGICRLINACTRKWQQAITSGYARHSSEIGATHQDSNFAQR